MKAVCELIELRLARRQRTPGRRQDRRPAQPGRVRRRRGVHPLQLTSPIRVPDHDIKADVRWLRANAKAYNLDPKRVAVMCDSSGGWTSEMAAVTSNTPPWQATSG
ncbi:hypothetical protein [Streptomyces sp900116325]|uniref:hypothetical protein n=1 Tax=Streptomyces sp. 900116325 TaxID=3154295 RepID=UPI0033B37FB3